MNAPQLSLAALITARIDAKAAEDRAIANRRQIDEMIAAAMPGEDEGTVSDTIGAYKVSVARKVTRSVNTETLTAVWPTLPQSVQAAFRWKADLDIKQLRALESVAPDQYRLAAAHVTTKPASPTITIKES